MAKAGGSPDPFAAFREAMDGLRKDAGAAAAGLAGDLKATLEERAGALGGVAAAAGAALDAARAKTLANRDALAALAEKMTAAAGAARSPLAPLANLTDALTGIGKKWQDAVRPVAEFRAALDAALAPVRAGKAAFDALAAPVRAFLAVPGQLAGAVGNLASKAGGMLAAPAAQLQSFFGQVQSQVAGLVGTANPGAVLRFSLALDDLNAVLGAALVPVLNQFTTLARTLGGALNGMTAEGKQLIAGLAAGAVGMGLFAAGAYAVQTALTGGIGPLLGAVAGALGGVAFASGALESAMKPVAEILGGVGNRLGEVLAKVAGSDAFAGLAVAFAEVAGVAIDLGASFLEFLMPAFSAAAELAKTLAPLAGVVMALNPQLLLLGGVVAAMAKGFELAAPYLIAFGEIAVEIGKTLFDVARQLLSVFGVDLGTFGAAPRSESKDNTGMAAKSTSTTDVLSVLRAARESSFKGGLGAKDDHAAKTASGVSQIATEAAQIREAIVKFIAEFPKNVADVVANTGRKKAVETAKAVSENPAFRVAAAMTPYGLASETVRAVRGMFP